MKKSNSKADEKKPIPVDKPDKAESAKLESKPKPAKPKKDKNSKGRDTTPLPVLVELTYTVSSIILIIAIVLVALVSIFSGATVLDLVIRTGVTTLVLGSLLVLISWLISSGSLNAFFAEQEEEKKAREEKDIQNDNSAEAR